MKEIVSKVTKGLETEMKVLEHTRMPITNWDCYEQTAKYYSRECFSIAKVIKLISYYTHYLLFHTCEIWLEFDYLFPFQKSSHPCPSCVICKVRTNIITSLCCVVLYYKQTSVKLTVFYICHNCDMPCHVTSFHMKCGSTK